jgi:hypothetical protein
MKTIIFALVFCLITVFSFSQEEPTRLQQLEKWRQSQQKDSSKALPLSDTIKEAGRNVKLFGNLKINPIKIIFCEIPVSLEVYVKPRSSLQFEVGYIYPNRDNRINEVFFDSQGEEGMATDEGLFSYRNSPFNNDAGINLKTEIRKYSREINPPEKEDHNKSFYYALQMGYKFCFYKKQTFEMHHGGATYYQTETKYSHIPRIGIMIGKQSFKHSFITDFYGGLGCMIRMMSVTIHEIYNPTPGLTQYPNIVEDKVSFYPFFNLGVRFGLEI